MKKHWLIPLVLLAVSALACGAVSSVLEEVQQGVEGTLEAQEITIPTIEVPTLAPIVVDPGTSSGTGGLAGNYSGTGINPDGSSYTVEATVAAGSAADRWTFSWTNGDTGLGLSATTALAVAVGDGCSVGLYALGSDGSLVGLWADDAFSNAGAEVMTPASGQTNIGGTYNVSGTNPDDSAFGGTVTITPHSGDLVWLDYVTGENNESLSSVGIISGGLLATATPSDCTVAVYNIGGDGVLTGIWGGVDFGQGSETLTPVY